MEKVGLFVGLFERGDGENKLTLPQKRMFKNKLFI